MTDRKTIPPEPQTDLDKALEKFSAALTSQMSAMVAQKNGEVLEAVKALGTLVTGHYERQQKQIDNLEGRLQKLEAATPPDRDTLPSSRSIYSLAAPRVPSIEVPKHPWWKLWGRGE